jgi:hypothetical protein
MWATDPNARGSTAEVVIALRDTTNRMWPPQTDAEYLGYQRSGFHDQAPRPELRDDSWMEQCKSAIATLAASKVGDDQDADFARCVADAVGFMTGANGKMNSDMRGSVATNSSQISRPLRVIQLLMDRAIEDPGWMGR